ncbi:unnamed protein product [Trichobilharzia regenti]|nr:unnamed protein product [Trichobilharzia regenti]
MVNAEAIQKYASRLCTLCNIQELRNTEKVDKDYLNSFVFPSWQYLTDVAATSIRGNRVSVSRRPIEIPPVTDCLPDSDRSADDCISVLKPLDSSNIVVPAEQSEKESVQISDQFISSNRCDGDEKDANVLTKISHENVPPKAMVSAQTTVRKRVTLDAFLKPPAKRSNNVSSEMVSLVEDSVITDLK